MSKKNRFSRGRITSGGNIPFPGQSRPNTIVLTQPKRFGIDTADFMDAIRAAENVDFSRRYRLYDLYSDILLDTHLSCVIEKRKNAILCSDIEFRRNGEPVEEVNRHIRSPWFNCLIADILDAKFWGFSLLQFYKDGEWANYDLVPRKHVDPVKRIILRQQTDITGTSWDEYPDLLFVGSPRELGLLAKAAPWVIYKRNTTADWAQFSEVFGMPIQEYTYDTDDDDSRRRALEDSSNAGALAVFVHGKDTELKLVEAGNKTGSADVYERLCERCNNELSKLILGNTLTTESSEKGTQALGTVHKKVEDKVTLADQQYILDVLNYEMTDIFSMLGIPTDGGEFRFTVQDDVDPNTRINILSRLHNDFLLPVDDEYLYNEFNIVKPANYKQLKDALLQHATQQSPVPEGSATGPEGGTAAPPPSPDTPEAPVPEGTKKKSFKNWLRGFFVQAPTNGAALDW